MFRAARWRVEKNKSKLVFELQFRATQGLQDVIKLVPIDLGNRPAWYKEKVYSPNKVASLEHNNEIKGESLDLIKYIDSHFEGPSLLPEDPANKKLTEEMFSYTYKFGGIMRYAFSSEGDVANEIGAFDTKLLLSCMSKLKQGQAIAIPNYHFKSHKNYILAPAGCLRLLINVCTVDNSDVSHLISVL